MPPKKEVNSRSIKDFFKPFTIPRNRRPDSNVIGDEIAVAPARPTPPAENLRQSHAPNSPKRKYSSQSTDDSSQSSTSSIKKQRTSRGKRDVAQLDGPVTQSSALSSLSSTPLIGSKRSPRMPVNAMELDNAVASATSSRSSSQRRVMTAVELPSSQHEREDSDSEAPDTVIRQPAFKKPELKPEVATRGVSTSFSSVTSLSSVPPSTQSSSRRIVQAGMKAVTNSDSDTDDDLPDPSTFLRSKPNPALPSVEVQQSVAGAARAVSTGGKSARLSEGSKVTSGRSTPRPRSPPRKAYKYSLSSMVKDKEKQAKADARILEMEAAFDQAHAKRQAEFERDEDLEAGLKAAVADDSDEGDRMMLAMQRTEALQDDHKFYYFQGASLSATSEEFPDFSDEHLNSTAEEERARTRNLMRLLQDERSRNHAYLTGFVAQMASKHPLPEALYSWMAGQLLYEQRDDLCEAYVETLRTAAAKADHVYSTLRHLGAFYNLRDLGRRKATENSSEKLKHEATLAFPESPPGLSYVLRTLQNYWIHMKEVSLDRASVLVELAFASIDGNVYNNADLQCLVQETIDIVSSVHGGNAPTALRQYVHSEFFRPIKPSLQLLCQAISALPATSECVHAVRRMLALHLVTDRRGGDQYVSDIQHANWPTEILLRLKKAPEWTIYDSTDYSLLKRLIAVLDIAIDAGFSTAPTKPLMQESSAVKLSPEQSFNATIDALTSQLQAISNRIRDSGATNLKRTEAKAGIERLVERLEHSVRTKPKARKGVFGGASEQQKGFLDGFLRKAEKQSNVIKVIVEDGEDSVSVVPEDMLSKTPSRYATSGSESAGVGADDESQPDLGEMVD